MTTFLDTNVLVYATKIDEVRHQWSLDQLIECKMKGPAVISDMVYCEFSAGMNSREEVDAVVAELGLERISFDDDCLFRAGEAFRKYKVENSGPKNNVLADFLIGAAAEVAGAPLVTANAKDYSSYFPGLKIISP